LAVCLCTSVVYGGDDVRLSEVPEAVRAAIARQLKGAEIKDIERDRDDGRIVYEVDAEAKGDRDIELKIDADGHLIREEREVDADELPPAVAEAVKKLVGQLDYDDIEMRLEPGRQAIYRIKGDKGDTEIELKVAADGTVLWIETDEDDDDDLPDGFAKLRRMFLELRGQLKIAAVGDSRVEKGIDPKYFLGQQNRTYPMALNFGEGGSGLGYVKVLIEDYLVRAAKLKWVVYGISPRAFNRYYHSDEGDDIRKSSTYRLDKQMQGWGTAGTIPIPASAVDTGDDDLSPWGFDGEDGMEDEIRSDRRRRDKQEDLQRGRYVLDQKRLEVFESLVELLGRRGVKILGFTPPIHPLSIGQPCTDDDGTTRQGYDEFVAKMKALDAKYENFYFVDVNNKGEHEFENDEFNNFDHLNKKGAKKLTLLLDELIKRFDSQGKKPGEHLQLQADAN